MVIIPDLETVVILNPRTGSGSLYRAILAKYPWAWMPYRHMEACGVPKGYDRWHKIGIVRHPLHRLWSLYNYIPKVLNQRKYKLHPAIESELSSSRSMEFGDWVINNRVFFPIPFRSMVTNLPDPFYYNNCALPENIKTQWHYLRPDLGTEIVQYENSGVDRLAKRLGVREFMGVTNVSLPGTPPAVRRPVELHIEHHFSWELGNYHYHL